MSNKDQPYVCVLGSTQRQDFVVATMVILPVYLNADTIARHSTIVRASRVIRVNLRYAPALTGIVANAAELNCMSNRLPRKDSGSVVSSSS